MNPMLNVAIQAVRKAGNFIIKQYEIFNKKNINTNYIYNFIHNTYTESNYIITTIIKKFYPLHTIITTYNNTHSFQQNKYQNTTHWIIDPIGNNINFIKQFPFFTVSIAVILKNHTEIGVIYDPIHNELFSACRGNGAQLNGYKIRVNTTTQKLYKSILAIHCPPEEQYKIVDFLKKLYHQNINFRDTGIIILDLAYIAVGRIDGCFAISTKKNHKLSIGALILQESGGLITDFTGSNNYIAEGNIIAGNPRINKMLISKLLNSSKC